MQSNLAAMVKRNGWMDRVAVNGAVVLANNELLAFACHWCLNVPLKLFAPFFGVFAFHKIAKNLPSSIFEINRNGKS